MRMESLMHLKYLGNSTEKKYFFVTFITPLKCLLSCHLTDLSREEGAIFEDAQVVSDGETSQHQTHGQQGGVGVRTHDVLSHIGDIACGVVTDLLMDHRWVPGVLYGVVQAVVVQDERVCLKDLEAGRRRGEQTFVKD